LNAKLVCSLNAKLGAMISLIGIMCRDQFQVQIAALARGKEATDNTSSYLAGGDYAGQAPFHWPHKASWIGHLLQASPTDPIWQGLS